MFIDKAKIFVKAGNGGNGSMSFHREKYVAAGGPDGGDGGRGGSVIFVADPNLSTLLDFKYKRKYAARNGGDGMSDNRVGKNAENLYVKVPVGTVVYDCLTGLILCDLNEPGMEAVIAKGGNGGYGNKRFATPTRQIPKFAKPGYPGEEREVSLELKLLADVGLVGFPNVGKSTFLSVSTKANPKIANYHFTTLIPNLGVADLGAGRSFIIADIPGVIEGASEGVGLGHDFLRHIERTRLLVHVLDASETEGRNVFEDFEIINNELVKFNEELSEREQIIVLNKSDLIYDEEKLTGYKQKFEEMGYKVFVCSGATKKGVKEILDYAYERLQKIPMPILYDEDKIYNEAIHKVVEKPYEVFIDDEGVFNVTGPFVERLLKSTNPNDYESMQYFQRALKSSGIIAELENQGIKEGDLVRLFEVEFEFVL
ncbi:MAG: GTPase ObgE [Ruminococcaceae bacterium]|nr:GTPase ObgE [Oscillospiraceae bacterium]